MPDRDPVNGVHGNTHRKRYTSQAIGKFLGPDLIKVIVSLNGMTIYTASGVADFLGWIKAAGGPFKRADLIKLGKRQQRDRVRDPQGYCPVTLGSANGLQADIHGWFGGSWVWSLDQSKNFKQCCRVLQWIGQTQML